MKAALLLFVLIASEKQTGILRGVDMFRREEAERILEQARRMDPRLEMFGVSDHQYRLGSPVD